MKTHYSIADLLALNLENYPTSRRGWEKFVQNNALKYREVPSRGKGGVRKEYELTVAIKELVVLKDIKANISSVSEESVTNSNIVTTTDLQKATELMNWQREVAENRLFIVRYIQQKVRHGMKKTPAIEQFIADADAHLLPKDMQLAVQKANAKAGEDRTVSRRSIFDWMKAVDDAESKKLLVISVLAPKARQVGIPAWAICVNVLIR